MLAALLPTIQNRFGLSESVLALLVATLSLSALVTQPLFGALADRLGNRRIAARGVISNAMLFSLIGIVPNVYILFGLILVGGLGSAALHPAIASMARLVGGKKPELAVGLFSAGGTLGIAVGPIIIMVLLSNRGLAFTPWLMIPGILLGVLMFILTPEDARPAHQATTKLFDFSLLSGPVGLLALTGVLSNVAFVTFTSAMPLWLVHEHGLPPNSALIGWTLSAFSVGSCIWRHRGRSDQQQAGRTAPDRNFFAAGGAASFLHFFLVPGLSSYFVMVMLAGVLVNAGMPMLIVMAQDHAPTAAATAAGMLMGFSAGVAGLVYVGIGFFQEKLGLVPAMGFGYLALVLAAILGAIAVTRKPVENPKPVESLSCLCSPCIDQNIAAFPQRVKAGQP
jgi:MFS transporter, FSR family, fosmidomycin resistance protein